MNLGDFTAGDTVDFKFTTRRFSTGAPHTLAGTPAVRVYKGSSDVEDDSGITLTVDFDGRTGLNHVTIDTSADGTFYANGSQFDVVITVGTVDSVSVVGEVVGRFTLGLLLKPTTTGRKLTVESDGMAHADVKEWLGTAPLALSSQQVQAVVPNTQKVDVETIKTQAVTASGGITFPAATLASTTNITAGTITTATNVTTVNGLAANVITATSIAADAITAAKIADGAIDSATFAAGAINAAAIADGAIDAATFAGGALDAVWSTTTRILTAATNITSTGGTTAPQTGDSFARIGAAGASLTDLGGMSTTMKTQVQTEAEDALVTHRLDELLNADSDIDGAAPPTVGSVFHELMSKTAGSFTFDQTTDSLEAIRDRGDAAWTTATGFSTHSAADVWTNGTRTLTAGTNIQLPSNGLANITAWTVAITGNITGNLSGSVGSVTTVSDKTGYSLASTGLNLVVPVEPSAVPTWASSTIVAWVGWLGAFARNKITQTATTQTLRNDADSGNIATSTLSDDGSTFSKGEWA